MTLAPRQPRSGAGPSESGLPVAAAVRPQAPRTNRTALVVAILCVAFAVLGVVFAVQRTSGSNPQPPGEPVAVGSSAPLTQLPPRKVVPDPDEGSAAPVEVKPPVPSKVQLRITSVPAGATIVLDGTKLGVTPLETSVDRADRSAELVVSRRGYTGIVRKIDLRDSVALEVSLAAVPKVTTNKPRGEPKKNTPEIKPPPKGDPSLDIRLTR